MPSQKSWSHLTKQPAKQTSSVQHKLSLKLPMKRTLYVWLTKGFLHNTRLSSFFQFYFLVFFPVKSSTLTVHVLTFLGFISIQLFVFLFMNESILGQKVLSRLEAGRISQLKLLSLPKENRHIWVNKNIANLRWICHFSWKNKSHQPESAYTFSNQN